MSVVSSAHSQPLYETEAYTLTDTSVVQGPFWAEAPSRTALRSNYQRERTTLAFKFSLNARDNEFPSGDDRRIRLDPVGGSVVTPVYVFGEQANTAVPRPSTVTRREAADSVAVTFRVDLRPVLRSFRDTGTYDPPAGEPIAEDEFEGVYILGDTSPLSWQVEDLEGSDGVRLRDPDDDGVYHTTLQFEATDVRPLNEDGMAEWTLSEDLSDYPSYRSDQPLVDALYNLSLEELRHNVRNDGAFMAGKKWTGVWTRDISYSILLSLALVDPEGAKTSLLHKVTDDGRIIQDTGTGGSWPVSTDRMTWALAAWEVYKTTGDEDWLRQSYDIIRRSARADLQTAFDSTTGLFYGETSFLDWREQSYPEWMEPKDIYQSLALGTNVVHYRTYRILAQMASTLGDFSEEWEHVARQVKRGINEHLWQEEEGRYSAYRYGRLYPAETSRAEALGSALAILSNVTDEERAARVARNQPVVEFGVPSFWPYIRDVPPYHNAGIWPFVGAYWTWASASAGNTPGVEHGLASLFRAAALFQTNKENMVAETGHFEGTEINSDRQLWSVAGTLSAVYRVLFGMRFATEGLRFDPFVPEAYSGTHTLDGVSYRNATLDLTLKGHGTRITQIMLDDTALDEPLIPADLEGRHNVSIVLSGGVPEGEINRVANRETPPTPVVRADAGTLSWGPIGDASAYRVYRNGTIVDTTLRSQYDVSSRAGVAEYQVQAVDARGLQSFRSAPVRIAAPEAVRTLQPEGALVSDDVGYTGDGYAPLSTDQNRTVSFEVTISESGPYAIDVRYANGHGPTNTDNKCAIRTVVVNGERVGAAVLPQRGDGVWTDWGYSNSLRTSLDEGTHTITVEFTDSDVNMNGEINAANLDHLRLTRLSQPRE